MGELVEANRHLEMKIILIEKSEEFHAYSPDTINFFLMMQHRIDVLFSYLLENEFIDSNETYNEFLHRSRHFLKEVSIEDYFNEFTKLMKELFNEVFDLNS